MCASYANVSSSSFSLKVLNESAYDFMVHFYDGKGHSVGDAKFTFIQEGNPSEEVIVDVFTKNGSCSPNLLSKLFSRSDVKEAKRAALKLGSQVTSTVMGVLDLKHPEFGYLKGGEWIGDCEKEVCAFFQSSTACGGVSTSSKNLHQLFKSSLPVDFILCEGSLKVDLVQQGGFTEGQLSYFHTKPGVVSFCQTAEFFMNAFKLGEVGYAGPVSFQGEHFITSVGGKAFQPCQVSSVLYPPLYKNVYSVEGEFAQVMSSVFSVTGGFDPATQITTLNVEKKP